MLLTEAVDALRKKVKKGKKVTKAVMTERQEKVRSGALPLSDCRRCGRERPQDWRLTSSWRALPLRGAD